MTDLFSGWVIIKFLNWLCCNSILFLTHHFLDCKLFLLSIISSSDSFSGFPSLLVIVMCFHHGQDVRFLAFILHPSKTYTLAILYRWSVSLAFVCSLWVIHMLTPLFLVGELAWFLLCTLLVTYILAFLFAGSKLHDFIVHFSADTHLGLSLLESELALLSSCSSPVTHTSAFPY